MECSTLPGIHSLGPNVEHSLEKNPPFSVAIPALEKTQGYIVAITSLGAQLRVPGGSDGCITKHAVNRLVEFIALGKIFISLVF